MNSKELNYVSQAIENTSKYVRDYMTKFNSAQAIIMYLQGSKESVSSLEKMFKILQRSK